MSKAVARGDAAAALMRGEAAIFPTDTVYGLGVAVGVAPSPQVLFELKGRPAGKPVAWLVADPSDLDRYGCEVPDLARRAARAFWPGPLTLIVKASERAPRAFCSKEGTVGLRMPASPVALDLIRAVGAPLATTSANLSGRPAPRSLEEVDAGLAARAGAVAGGFDGGAALPNALSGQASTVVDCTGARPVVLREGAVSLADILTLV